MKKFQNYFFLIVISLVIFFLISSYLPNTPKLKSPKKTASHQDNFSDSSNQSDLVSMIYVSSHLYMICNTDDIDTINSSKWTYIGQISSCVNSSLKPQEELQANDEIVGAKVYNSGEKLLVKYNEKQWIYQLYQ